jgi:hypothetical protein
MPHWNKREYAKRVGFAALGLVAAVIVFTNIGAPSHVSGRLQPAASTASTPASPTFPGNPSSVPGTPMTPVTAPPLVEVPTVTVTYPNPYDPGYNTIAQLVDDSDAIVVGTLGSTSTAPGQDGAQTAYYQINIQKTVNDVSTPRISLYVSQNLVNAARLSSSGTYIFFWAGPADDGTSDGGGRCITGGTRGVMAYNQSADTVTRLDNNSDSQIPRTQTLEQLKGSIRAAFNALETRPIVANPPPACTLSATGLSQ